LLSQLKYPEQNFQPKKQMNSSTLIEQNTKSSGEEFNSNRELPFSYEKEIIAGQTVYHKKEYFKVKKVFYMRLAILLAMINLMIIINSFGQLVTVNNISLSNSAQITIKGDLLNSSGTTITNSGTIDLTGNLVNNSGTNLFGTSDGNVTLNGANQNISGSNGIQFYDLSLSGSGTKILQQDISVGGSTVPSNGVLDIGARMLDLNSNELTITNASNSGITRSSGFIVSETGPAPGYGVIKWQVQNNSGTYNFPFGNSGSNSYVPVTLEIAQAGSGTNGYVSIATYPTVTSATPNNRPLPTGLSSLIDNFGIENASNVVDRWWMLDVANYTTKPVSNISFTYRESEWDATAGSTNTLSESDLQAQSNDGSMWTPLPIGNVNVGMNTVTVSNINVYNPFWTLVGSSNPLPMTLLAFNAQLNSDGHVDLDWATATEINNDYFTLEKSKNGIDFEPFASVDGAGNSNNVLYYTSIDKNPYNGISYYRLKQTDYDGQFSYSEIKTVRIKNVAATVFQVFPNPATDHFYVKFDDETVATSLLIVDMNGKLVREIAMEEVEIAGAGLIKVSRLTMNAGMYFVSTPEGKMQKLILQ